MTEIRIYFEGDKKLRPGFHAFLKDLITHARRRGVRFELIAGGSQAAADYALALEAHPEAWNILLRDSEGSDIEQQRDTDFWMVQLMEAWFLAHPEALESYYGQGFRRGALKSNPRVEEIPKGDVIPCLHEATRETKKGRYHKTRHAPDLLGKIDPNRVRGAAPNCERLFKSIQARLNQEG